MLLNNWIRRILVIVLLNKMLWYSFVYFEEKYMDFLFVWLIKYFKGIVEMIIIVVWCKIYFYFLKFC